MMKMQLVKLLVVVVVLFISNISRAQDSNRALKEKSTFKEVSLDEQYASKFTTSKHKFVLESKALADDYLGYDFVSLYGIPIYYENSDLQVNEYFSNNFISLTKLYDALHGIMKKKDQKISKIVVVGYSSPDGYAVVNSDIAKKRAEQLKDKLSKVIGLPADKIEAVNGGENWEALYKIVLNSSLKDKNSLLNIINYKSVLKNFNRIEDPINSDREKKMMDIHYSISFDYIKKNYYPLLRVAYIMVFIE